MNSVGNKENRQSLTPEKTNKFDPLSAAKKVLKKRKLAAYQANTRSSRPSSFKTILKISKMTTPHKFDESVITAHPKKHFIEIAQPDGEQDYPKQKQVNLSKFETQTFWTP